MVIQRVVQILLLCFCLSPVLVQAAVVDLSGTLEQNQRLSEQTLVYEDATGTLSAKQISALPDGPAGFQPLRQLQGLGKRTQTPWWSKVTLANAGASHRSLRVVLNPGTVFHTADFYTLHGTEWLAVDSSQSATDGGSEITRFDSIALSLAPGQKQTLLIRTTGAPPAQLAPYLYTDSFFKNYLAQSAIWDGLLFGGLLALAWVAWMLALFTRSRAFLILGLLSFSTLLVEALRRDYLKLPFFSDALEWSYRSPLILGQATILLFMVFILEIARAEKIRLPLRNVLVGWVIYNAALILISAFGDVYKVYWLNHYLRSFQSLSLLLIALLFVRQNAPTRKLMLAVAVFSLARASVMVLETNGTLPSYIEHLSIGSLRLNPIVALSGFFINLTLLAGWVAHVGKQRKTALEKVAQLQRDENERLTEEVARQTAALNKALAYADEKNRQQTQIVSYISHDLRAPLATSAGYTKLIERTASHQQKPLLKAIERSIDYQLSLIDDILAYATAELKPLDTKLGQVQLADYLDEITLHAVALSKQQDNRFTIDVTSAIPKAVWVDGRRLRQVLLNLLSNAAKFTRGGQIRLELSATQTEHRGWDLHFAVSDSGIGIETEAQEQIFQEFRQLETSSEGVGLGLYIAQSILRTMGSGLNLKSTTRNGSTFSFQIHVAAADSETTAWTSPAHLVCDIFNEPILQTPCLDPEPAACEKTAEPATENLPPRHDRNALAQMAKNGQLTDTEHWLDTMTARYPACSVYLQKIAGALARLDLEAVERLALIDAR